MSIPFVPDVIAEKLTDITPDFLKSRDIDFLMLDFDNTIVPYTQNTPTPEMEAWLKMMSQSGIGMCVVSNSKRDRVVKFCRARDIPCITHSRKPFPKGIRQCRERFALDLSRTALVGDQIYTDVLGANCAGALSILVTPIHLHNIWLYLRHVAEKPFIAMGRKNTI